MSQAAHQLSSAKFRFAPSPNGRLHLGHAYSALLNQQMAHNVGGDFVLRIEDIDLTRCTPELEQAIYDDLNWLGLEWPEPVRRQSDHFETYIEALQTLIKMGLAYPAAMTRGGIKAFVKDFESNGRSWPRDPDGAPLYPACERDYSAQAKYEILNSGKPFAWRLDMAQALNAIQAPLEWIETSEGQFRTIAAQPGNWGDIILSRSDALSSYHLSVVTDDAIQDITHVVRGEDLYQATSIHRLLQALLNRPAPIYHHHKLLLDQDGRKLSKSIKSTGIAELKTAGLSPSDIRGLIGL